MRWLWLNIAEPDEPPSVVPSVHDDTFQWVPSLLLLLYELLDRRPVNEIFFTSPRTVSWKKLPNCSQFAHKGTFSSALLKR